MSLTKLLAKPATRDFLKPRLTVPRITPPAVLVAPGCRNVQRVGTAFDYALRYGLRARGIARHHAGTVAASAVDGVGGVGGAIARLAPERLTETRARLTAAVGTLEAMSVGPLSAAAADACLELTALELVHRSKRLNSLDATPEPDEATELQRLFAIVPWDQLKANEWSTLNPRFGIGSSLVGGADADFCVDGTLIDIKTTKSTSMTVGYARQLIGYAVLAEEFGITGMDKGELRRVGIYFSRAGSLHTWALDELMGRSARREFGQFIREGATPGRGWRIGRPTVERHAGDADDK